jgi:hypothetical protein
MESRNLETLGRSRSRVGTWALSIVCSESLIPVTKPFLLASAPQR